MTDCTCNNFPASLGNVTFGASVGIGTANPAGLLDVAGSGTDVACFVGPADDHYGTLVLRGGTSGTYWELAKLTSTDPAPDGWSLLFVNGSTSTPVLVATTGGYLGIGTTSPSYPLDVAGDINTRANLRYTSGSAGLVGLVDNDNHAIRSNGLGSQVFANNWGIASQGWIFRDEASGTDRVMIQSNGNVGIGTTTPQSQLHLNGGSLLFQSTVVNPVVGGYSTASLTTNGYGDLLIDFGTSQTGAVIITQAGTQVLGLGTYGLFLGPAGPQNRKVADQNGCYYA
ncbi:MAG: hypothetical protein M1296_00465 [Chloroflexi bacterium]|nr:hypothetical protein [Chloroflexota bacterium]